MDAERSIRYLASALVLDTLDPAAYEAYVESELAKAAVVIDPDKRPRIRIGTVAIPDLKVHYTDVEGSFVRITNPTGLEAGVVLMLGGQFWHCVEGVNYLAGPRQGLLSIPGGFGIQAAKDAKGFTLRIPISEGALFHLRAQPYSIRKQFDRMVAHSDAEDLTRLIQFFCLEYERLRAPGYPEPKRNLEAVGLAIRERFRVLIAKKVGNNEAVEPDMLQICLAADRLIQGDLSQRYTANDLAAAANCSVRQLYRAFAEVAAVSPLDYQTRLKLHGIRRCIFSDLNHPVNNVELAGQHGFTGSSWMVTKYREEYGESPQETRLKFIDYRDAMVRDRLGIEP